VRLQIIADAHKSDTINNEQHLYSHERTVLYALIAAVSFNVLKRNLQELTSKVHTMHDFLMTLLRYVYRVKPNG